MKWLNRLAFPTMVICIAYMGYNLADKYDAHKVRVASEKKTEIDVDEHGEPYPIVGRFPGVLEQSALYVKSTAPVTLYVFRPGCAWCDRNDANIRVISEARTGNPLFVGVSLSTVGLSEYLGQKRFNFPVLADLTPETVKHWKLGLTPELFVFDKRGRLVLRVRGADDNDKYRLEKFFNVKLPGLLPPADAHATVVQR